MHAGEATPVLLVAGGLGAGKTTLLARWMADPDCGDTALLLNDPGGVSIDAHLVGGLAGATRSLAGGCVCCAARDALAPALESLAGARRGAPRFGRVVIELSGLAHPAPVLETLASDEALRERFPLHGIATIVDCAAGLRGLDDAEARASVTAADVLVLAKTDLAAAPDVERLVDALVRLNPDAQIVRSGEGSDAGAVWQAARSAPRRELRRLDAAVQAAPAPHEGVAVHTLAIDAPIELSGFCVRLLGFLQEHAGRVLRVKGFVPVRGRRGPAVIQAVGASLHPVRTLRGWPVGVSSGALVVITRSLDESTVSSALS